MKSKLVSIIVVSIFFITFMIFFLGLKNSNIYTPNINLKKKVPFFVLKSFYENNDTTTEKIFEDDKFYLMNIWSSWCIPCRDEHKFLMKLKLNKKIELIGFNYKDKINNAKKFLDELGDPYTKIVIDGDGTASINWGAYGVPESFLIYQNKVIKRYIGPINDKSLTEIEKIIE
tara:strand:- start:864 stop:1382 length:519 start_codon:yes stop_codon:yes gene_type:complete